MRRLSLLAAAALAAALSVAACGGGPATPTASGSETGEGTVGDADPGASASPGGTLPVSPPPGAGGGGALPPEDCYTYDAQVLISNYAAGVHAIRPDGGSELIRVYGGPADPIGAKAISVATRFNKICYIGRGNSLDSPEFVFEYWLQPSGMVHPTEPAGLFSDCVDYEPADLQVSTNPGGSGWVVRAGGNVLQAFATEADANAGLAVLILDGQLCYLTTQTPEGTRADITFTINTGD